MTSNKPKRIGALEIVDHGIDHSQYFPGCGVAFTSFDYVVTGIGNNPAEAIDNCLEEMAMDGFDVEGMETRIQRQEGWDALPDYPSVSGEFGCDETGEAHYFDSIRWNEER